MTVFLTPINFAVYKIPIAIGPHSKKKPKQVIVQLCMVCKATPTIHAKEWDNWDQSLLISHFICFLIGLFAKDLHDENGVRDMGFLMSNLLGGLYP